MSTHAAERAPICELNAVQQAANRVASMERHLKEAAVALNQSSQLMPCTFWESNCVSSKMQTPYALKATLENEI